MSGSQKDLEIKEPEPFQKDLEIKDPEPFQEDFKSESGDPKKSLMALEPKEGETPEEEAKRIAKRLFLIVDKALEKVKPFCEMIDEKISKAERTDKEELDEEHLVQDVKPLIERSTTILQECHGAIKALDPDGKITNNAQARAKNNEATPEEQQLAQGLSELAGQVSKTIQHAKEVIKDMPHAQNKLGPLLDMFGEPLFQILSAVGLLLNGVLGLVAGLLDGLGLGGIVRGLLDGLGLSKLLTGLGLGKWLEK